MSIKTASFIKMKMKIVELFLAEKLACVPLKEIPKRCSKEMHADGKEVYKVDGNEVLEVSTTTTAEGNPAFRFSAFKLSKSDHDMLAEIVKEVSDDHSKNSG